MSELLKKGDLVRHVGVQFDGPYAGARAIVAEDQDDAKYLAVTTELPTLREGERTFLWWLGPGWEIEKVEDDEQ